MRVHAGTIVIARPSDDTTLPTVGRLGRAQSEDRVITHFADGFRSPKGFVFLRSPRRRVPR